MADEYIVCRIRREPAQALLCLRQGFVGSGQLEIVEYAARIGVRIIYIIFFAVYLFVYYHSAVADGIEPVRAVGLNAQDAALVALALEFVEPLHRGLGVRQGEIFVFERLRVDEYRARLGNVSAPCRLRALGCELGFVRVRAVVKLHLTLPLSVGLPLNCNCRRGAYRFVFLRLCRNRLCGLCRRRVYRLCIFLHLRRNLFGLAFLLRRYGLRFRLFLRGYRCCVALFKFEQFSLVSLHERDYIFVVHKRPPLGKICRASVLRARKDIPYLIYCLFAFLVTQALFAAYHLARGRRIL